MTRLTPFSKLLIGFCFAIIVFFIVLIFSGNGFGTNREAATKALLDSGYHPIDVGGYGILKCSEDDWYKTNFRAYSPDSTRIVTGCVCQGFFKGSTIRLD
jgi:hypothetical protein